MKIVGELISQTQHLCDDSDSMLLLSSDLQLSPVSPSNVNVAAAVE